MTAATLTRPAAGLMGPGHDPRPCVVNPPQWWDLGNEHNPRAVRYCRNVCPLRDTCKPIDGVLPKGQIFAGNAYNEYGKKIGICPNCDHPRARVGRAGPITCGCTPKPVREAMARQEANRQAAKHARNADQPAQHTSSRHSREDLINQWLLLHCAGLDNKQAAARMGVEYAALKSALHRARSAGDPRVPLMRAARKPVAA